MNQKTVLERFLDYVTWDTTSVEGKKVSPSSKGQVRFAEHLKKEMEELGFEDISLSQHAVLKGYLPATPGEEDVPVLGLISHLDTSPQASGHDVKARVVPYKGGNIDLGHGEVLSPENFPSLKKYEGQDIVVTNGSTLLGADDKAGIAEIMTLAQELVLKKIPHGKLAVAFTPDEEIGLGNTFFEVEHFGADVLFTVDGGPVGEVGIENFNAITLRIAVRGRGVHPGSAKNIMINSVSVLRDLDAMLPQGERPENTSGREGFYHVYYLKGTEARAEMGLLLRDFDRAGIKHRDVLVRSIVRCLKLKYPGVQIRIHQIGAYNNMYEKLHPVRHKYLEPLFAAMKDAGVEAYLEPIRGGTDGAVFTSRGFPCPNIFAGGENFHTVQEYIPVPSMKAAKNVLLHLVERLRTV